jgi:EAL domain-containing protein (putative c-di-GMP-specific phosphodiesterase class I)
MAYPDTTASAMTGGTNRTAGEGASGEHAARRFNTEDVSTQLLRILHPLHVDSLSLHDAAGGLLWLNEGAFGPDEHGVVLDALDVFALDSTRQDLQLKLDSDRTAVFASARNGGGDVCGIALAIVETPTNEQFAAKLGAPRLTQQMRRFAHLLAPGVPAVSAPAAAAPASISPPEADTLEPRARPAHVPMERRARPSAAHRGAARSATIHARRYARLRAGGAARRYEVKLAPGASSATDLSLATRVLEHLQRSGDRHTQTPSSFAVPISAESVMQTGWMASLQPTLARTNLPEGLVGFSLPRAAWQQQFEATERFIGECETAGLFVALDDFTLGDSGLALLRSNAVKCLKLDAALIGAVVTDKFAHATLAAIVQAARVLGLYCVAKQVSSSSQVKWLAAAGIEFADGVSRGVAVASTTKSGEVLALAAEQ